MCRSFVVICPCCCCWIVVVFVVGIVVDIPIFVEWQGSMIKRCLGARWVVVGKHRTGVERDEDVRKGVCRSVCRTGGVI